MAKTKKTAKKDPKKVAKKAKTEVVRGVYDHRGK
jgi:hypothetical protein